MSPVPSLIVMVPLGVFAEDGFDVTVAVTEIDSNVVEGFGLCAVIDIMLEQMTVLKVRSLPLIVPPMPLFA